MELKIKNLFLSTLDEVISVRQDCGLENGKAESLKGAVQNMPLLVPVVGEFSAGKSSLLNRLMGKDKLAVAMDPETAIPAELYYSDTEYDEGVRQDGSTERITDIAAAVGKYVCVKRHICSPVLRDIEPVVLVDMPGFDSPLDAHNRAIFNYLERGIHYAVLIPADAGTISKSMERQIENILSFRKTCTFFLSRTDLRSEEEIEEVRNGLQGELSVLTGEPVSIECVSQDDVSLFGNFVHSLNVDELFGRQFRESIMDECYDTKSSLSTKIAALQTGADKNRKVITELENAIQKIEEKKEKLIEQAGKDTFSDEADTVVSEVGNALNAELDTLVSIAKSRGSSALQEEINSIIQNAVVSKTQTVMEKVSVRFGREITDEVKGLDTLLENYNAGGVIDKFQQSAQTMFDSTKTAIDSYIKNRQKQTGSSAVYKTITGVLAATTSILSPIIEVLVILLPDIIRSIFGSFEEKRREEQLRESITCQIPSLKRQVRTKVVEILRDNSSSTITAICAKFDEELQKKKQEIAKAQQDAAANAAEVSAQIEKYSSGEKRIDGLLAKVME